MPLMVRLSKCKQGDIPSGAVGEDPDPSGTRGGCWRWDHASCLTHANQVAPVTSRRGPPKWSETPRGPTSHVHTDFLPVCSSRLLHLLCRNGLSNWLIPHFPVGLKFILMETTVLFLLCSQVSTVCITLNYIRAYDRKDKTGITWFGDKHPGSRSVGVALREAKGALQGETGCHGRSSFGLCFVSAVGTLGASL